MKKGFHSVFEKDWYRAIDFAAEHHFQFVQFDLGVPNNFLDAVPEQRLTHMGAYAKSRGIEITFHGPCDNVSLFSDYPCIRKGILEQYRCILDKAKILGARHLTLHTGQHPIFKKANEDEAAFLKSYGSYYENILCENMVELMKMSGSKRQS